MHARRLSPTKSGSSLTSNGSISRSSLVGLGFDTSDEVVPLDEHYYGAYTDPQPSSANRSPLLGSTSPSPSPRLSTAPHFDTLSEASARLERRGSWQPLHAASSSSSSAVSTSASQPSLHVTSGRMSRSGSLNAVPLSIDTTQSALAFRPPSPTIRSYPMTSTASSSSAHQRQISLTSACLPATASYAPDRLKYASSPDEGATSTVSLRGSPNLRSTVDFDGPHASASSARNSHEREDSANARSKGKSSRKQWRVMRMFSPRIDEKGTSEMHSPVITDSPRVAARSRSAHAPYATQNPRTFFGLPCRLIAPLLGPFANTLLPSSPASVKGAVALPPKKQSLPYRLASIFYICFSLFFLTSHLLGYDSSATSRLSADSAKRLIARTRINGSDAQNKQFAMGGWAEGIAKGFREKMPVAGSRWHLGADEDAAAAMPKNDLAPVADDDFSEMVQTPPSPPPLADVQEPLRFDEVNRKWGSNDKTSPLTDMSHAYRFSKMHSKVTGQTQDEMAPFAFRGDNIDGKGEVTACLYTNEAWLHLLPEFASRWNGPISLVFETLHTKTSIERKALLSRIAALRKENSSIRSTVDVHIVSTIPSTELSGNRTRERLITRPVASNYQLNLARFFARTEMVWLVGDARVLPSVGLRRKLAVPSVRKLAMSMGDALVIPTFANLRIVSGEGTVVPPLKELRTDMGIVQAPSGGVSASEFLSLGKAYADAHLSTLQLPLDRWPKRKSILVGLSSLHPPATIMAAGEAPPTGPVFGLYDNSWDIFRGPSNWNLWRKGSVDPRLNDQPETGGGAGLGINGGVGGGHVVYKINNYDLHYAPSVVISKDAQPWCTERFSLNKAACVYQMYLTGAELWVLPDEWAFTLESVDAATNEKPNDADKLKDSISSRLYTKFHAEACMHYGREFLSMSLWEHSKVSNIRAICARVFSTWDLSAKTAGNLKLK